MCPIEDRRRLDATREGMAQGFSLGSYCPVDLHAATWDRSGSACISPENLKRFARIFAGREPTPVERAPMA
jgi:hypothetical protein